MPYLGPTQVERFRRSSNVGIFWRLGTDPAAHLWMGASSIRARIPNLDVLGTTYIGGGTFKELPELDVLLNGQAERVDFSISGIPLRVPLEDGTLLDIEDNMPDVEGAECHIAGAALGPRWQLITQLIPLWFGLADYWVMAQPAQTDPDEPAMRTLIVSCAGGDAARSVPQLVSWTQEQQALVSAEGEPVDLFCNRVGRYTQAYSVTWPRF